LQNPVNIEQELLTSLSKGERKATELVYRQNHKMVTSWIQQNGGDEADANDIYQEAMTILFEKSQSEDFRLTCKIGTYLFAIGKHLWYKKLQQMKKKPGFLPDDAGGENGADWAYEEEINGHKEREMHYSQLDTALDQLGEPCRSLLKSFYHGDKSMVEIAAEFGYTNPDNAKTQKYKCLTRLRKIFYGVQANGNI
jgi:RNA polymerase sigma factor (sigma-70 family)